VHPEAEPLTENSVSSCIWLAYIFKSNGIRQSDTRVHWALSERLCFWKHPLSNAKLFLLVYVFFIFRHILFTSQKFLTF